MYDRCSPDFIHTALPPVVPPFLFDWQQTEMYIA